MIVASSSKPTDDAGMGCWRRKGAAARQLGGTGTARRQSTTWSRGNGNWTNRVMSNHLERVRENKDNIILRM